MEDTNHYFLELTSDQSEILGFAIKSKIETLAGKDDFMSKDWTKRLNEVYALLDSAPTDITQTSAFQDVMSPRTFPQLEQGDYPNGGIIVRSLTYQIAAFLQSLFPYDCPDCHHRMTKIHLPSYYAWECRNCRQWLVIRKRQQQGD